MSLNLLAKFLFFFVINTPNVRERKSEGPEAEVDVVYREKSGPMSLLTEQLHFCPLTSLTYTLKLRAGKHSPRTSES